MDSENYLIVVTNETDNFSKDSMNNEVTSTSDINHVANISVVPSAKLPARNNENLSTNSSPDSHSDDVQSTRSSNTTEISQMSPTNATNVQNSFRNISLNDTIHIPIVGYEVMEERARFTIFKLKVVDERTDQSWLVFRRYTDFVRLYSRVKAERPSVNLPLPGKRWFRDNFEPVFLEERVRGLQIFVNSIIKRLPNNPRVREFFCLDEPPQMCNYQPEVQAVYGALEDSISSLKTQLKQKDTTIMYLQQRIAKLESTAANCQLCGKNSS